MRNTNKAIVFLLLVGTVAFTLGGLLVGYQVIPFEPYEAARITIFGVGGLFFFEAMKYLEK